jgi:hypothetical protein
VISKKKKKIFWSKLDLFIEKNRFLLEKKFCRSAVCRLARLMAVKMKSFVRLLFERCFQIRDFFLETEGIGLTGVSFHFWPQKQIPPGSCHMNFWLFFHFHVKDWSILMFLALIWCEILCWAQKNIFHGV